MPYSLLACFFASLALSLALTAYVRNWATAKGVLAAPELGRHVHTRPVPRLGGVAVYASVILILLLSLVILRRAGLGQAIPPTALVALVGPATIVFLLGLYDDLRGANAYLKFGVQAIAAGVLYFGGYGVERFDLFARSHVLGMAVGLPVTIFWVLLVTNAFNLIDGLDGLAAGSAFFSTVVMFAISLYRGNFATSFITIVLAGAILGFLRLNFSPATIFLGDSGSLFVGFLLSAVALAGSQKATTIVAVTIPAIAFGLPILDVALAVLRRFLRGRPLFSGDNDHIHHKLLKRGLSQREAVLTLYGVTAGFGLLSLALLHGEKMLAIVLTLIGLSVIWGVRQLRYIEFSELHQLLQRAAMRRRIIANNVNVRQAAESLRGCKDLEGFCRVMREAFEPLGFDGFCLENFSEIGLAPLVSAPFCCDPKGRLRYSWSGEVNPEPAWELRLQLSLGDVRPRPYLCLFQIEEDRPLPFDLRVVTDGVRASISDAILTTIMQARQQSDRARAAGHD